MIEITDVAKKELKRMLDENTQDPAVLLRLAPTPEGSMGLIMDNVSEDDEIVEHEGIKLLAINRELAGVMSGASMDIEDTKDGPMLTFRGNCGCGGGSCGDGCGGCGDEGGHCC